MHRSPRRNVVFLVSSAFFILLFIYVQPPPHHGPHHPRIHPVHGAQHSDICNCGATRERYPVAHYHPVPPPARRKLPRIQHKFGRRTKPQHARRDAVKAAFKRCWNAYRENAWMADELMPLTGGAKEHFGGWAATLVDASDTLWIMGMKEEFWEAVDAAVSIDFRTPGDGSPISVFETTIRYLGGLLAAYDLSGEVALLEKAVELGDVLYGAFDTPNRMPITHWNMEAAGGGEKQVADSRALVADIGSLTLEFTRLSQITKDPKYYDAVSRITRGFGKQQKTTNVPGMWPYSVDAAKMDFHSGMEFSVGAMTDSLYEYLVKMDVLLGGSKGYEQMYKTAVDAIIKHAIFRPMVPDEANILMVGKVKAVDLGLATLRPEVEHLGCFAGGMLALGGRLLRNTTHIEIGQRLAVGCFWAYEASPLGVMPEDFSIVACASRTSCPWDEILWQQGVKERSVNFPYLAEKGGVTPDIQRLPKGFTSITNRNYILRPEAIESIFILYRITGDATLQDIAWKMFQSIQNATKTDLANSAISDVTDPMAPKRDEMESFWLAETLKYFYLIFSEPSLISLDEYVFNTEAHPLRRPKRGFWG